MDDLIQNRDYPASDSFPVTTMDGETVRIVEKVADAQRGTILISEDGSQHVEDAATGFVMKLEDAPLDETAEQAPADADGSPQEDDPPAAEPTPAEPTEDDLPPAEPTEEELPAE